MILLTIVENQLVNVLIAILIVLVIGCISFYALNRTTWSADVKNFSYAGIAIVLIILFLYFLGAI